MPILPFSQLLELLAYNDSEHVSITYRPAGANKVTAAIVPISDAPAYLTDVVPAAADAWFGVNPVNGPARQGVNGTVTDVTRLAALWVDLDFKNMTLDTARAIITDLAAHLGTEPSAIVHSGNGLHPYWPVDDAPVTDANRGQVVAVLRRWGRLARLVAKHHGTTVDSVFDLSRILRIPGTVNIKYTPAAPVTLETAPGGPITVDRVVEVLDELGVPEHQGDNRVGDADPATEPSTWRYADKPCCAYTGAMVKAWAADTPTGGRHQWLLAQATRLAAAHALGCLTAEQHRANAEALDARFTQLCQQGIGGDPRPVKRYEVGDALAYGVRQAAGKDRDGLLGELGGAWEHWHTLYPVADATDATDATARATAPKKSSDQHVATVATDATANREDGAAILDAVEKYLARFVCFPSEHARVAYTLWIAHTHMLEAFESTPRFAFMSPEPGSGKTRALEVAEPLVPRPVHAVNCTLAYLFRKVGAADGKPTIFYDEIDTVFGPKAKDNEDIRGMLNAGHRKGAVAGRCVMHGKKVETEEIDAYAAVAVAGLHHLPDTIATRSVIVRMRRRKAGEKVEPWRRRLCEPEGRALGERLAAWAAAVEQEAADYWPDMPEGVEDRNADVWEALIAVADLAGATDGEGAYGNWPERARAAAVAIVSESTTGAVSLGMQLLRDIRAVFNENGADKLPTIQLIAALVRLDESPWARLNKGEAIDSRALAELLGEYGIRSKILRDDYGVKFRGYRRSQFADAWERYLVDDDQGDDEAA